MSAWQGQPQRRVRRRHPFRTLLIVVLVLAALLVVADRVACYVAERAIGQTLQNSQHLPSRPGVDIAGFPFLTQLAAGKSDKITITAAEVPVDHTKHVLTLSHVQVVLHQVTADRSFDRFHAATAQARATITYPELSHALGIDVAYAGDGRVRASKKVTVLGQSFQASISAQPSVVNDVLGFGKTSINGLNRISGDVSAALDKVFDLHIPLEGIPFGVHVTTLRVDAAGAEVALAGSDLSYATKN